MKRIVLLIAVLLIAASGQFVSAQDQPGTVRFPTALDSPDSLFRVKNNSHSNLSTSITTGSTSITVTDASSFPASGALSIDSEIIYYTTKTGNTFSGLTRGASSTTAAAHTAGVIVRSPILAVYHETLANAIIAVQTKLGSGAAIDPLKIGAGTVNSARFGYLSNVTGDVQAQLDAKAPAADLTSEATTRASADTTLQSNITAESTARASADTTLQTNITSEASTRASADTTLQTNITAEASARAAADASLQPLDSDLTAFAGLSPSNDDLLQRKAGAWTYRTLTQVKADLAIASGDVSGLGTAATRNVAASGNAASGEVVKGDDTRLTDARSPTTHTHTASQVTDFNSAADGRIAAALGVSVQAFDADLGVIAGLTPSNDDILQRKGGNWINRTPAQFKADLALVAADISNFNNAVDARINYPVTSVFGRTGAVVAATNDYTWAQINKATSSIADITTRSASDLSSGTLPDARFPATLPAASGVNLTALNASNLGSGTVPTARLGSGTADSSKFLRGDNSWQSVSASPGGSNEDVQINRLGAFSGDSGLHVSGAGSSLDLQVGRDVYAGRDVEIPNSGVLRFGGSGGNSIGFTPSVGPVFFDSLLTNAHLTLNLQSLTADREWTFPNTDDTFVGLTSTQTLTNKTLTSPVINSPTGITKSDVGLSNVTNTSDANKPVSTAQQAALDLKANIASPTFTTTLTSPSASISGTAGAGFLQIANQSSAPSTPSSAGRIFFDNSGQLSWLRTDGFTRNFSSTVTANRTFTWPDANITVAGINLAQTWSAQQTFTSPKVLTDISDTNGNELIKFTATGSAVNEITVTNAATGNSPSISATGGDTNIDVKLTPKGTGYVNVTQTGIKFPDGTTQTTGSSLYNALTLQNSWASAGGAWGTPSYSRMGNLVCWQGLLTTGSNATVVFTLPAAARPNADTIVTGSSEAGWNRFNIVASTGAVTVNNYTGSVLSLSGVCYVVP